MHLVCPFCDHLYWSMIDGASQSIGSVKIVPESFPGGVNP